MLDVIGLDFDYQDRPLLKQVNFHLPRSGLLHITGTNGRGKTTLLKLLAGLYHPQAGSLRVSGEICYIGHQSGIHKALTPRENCLYDVHYDPKKQGIDSLASPFQLQSLLDTSCALLSTGQQKQVGLLRLWMTKATLWLLDEPLVALDQASLAVLMAKLQAHRQAGGAVVLTSHQNLPLPRHDYQVYAL